MEILEDKIITRFGVLAKITIDNAKTFSVTDMAVFVSTMALSYPTHLTITHKEMD
jgi:hypothetical protein